MVDELLDIFDEENKPTNIKKTRSDAHKDGSWHRVVHAIIYNSKGEMLIQLRAKDKKHYPNLWDISAAGHISAGEDPIVSCMREIEEEVGLKVDVSELKLYGIDKGSVLKDDGDKDNEFGYVYFLKFDGDVNSLKPQIEEVQKVEFISLDKLEDELKNDSGRFCPHGDYWFEMINETRRLI